MRLYLLISFALLSNSFTSFAQEHCSSDEMQQQWVAERSDRTVEMESFYRSISEWSKDKANSRSVGIIPVVVHVIHGGQSVGSGANLSVQRIQSQIDILNEDFNRMNADASNTPTTFAGVAGNPSIQFCLAAIDPSGNSTSGITRHVYNVSNTDFMENSIKPATTWDSDNYLNIWTVDIPSQTIIGYSYLPTSSMVGSDRDGVVVTYDKFGFVSSSNRGRTATHEVGHYLGLRHMWGSNDSNGNPIGCSSDDNISDTPESDDSYFGCPNSGFSCGSSDMYMNFMDYVDDNCMNLFTQGQSNVMNSTLNGIRSQLISGNLSSCTSECVSLNSSDYETGFEPSQNTSNWSIDNNNGDNRTWLITDESTTDWGPDEGQGVAVYLWNASSSADDYLFSPCFEIKQDHQYRLRFSYAAAQDANAFYPEKFRVGFSQNQSASDFIMISDDWIFDPVSNAYPSFIDEELFFTSEDDLSISLGFHVFSAADQYALMIDKIELDDLGAVGTSETELSNGLSVFPNPSEGNFRFEVPEDVIGGNLRVYNSLGQAVVERKVSYDAQEELDLTGLNSGVYYLELIGSDKKYLERLIKQ